jgi:prephenate dehydratase
LASIGEPVLAPLRPILPPIDIEPDHDDGEHCARAKRRFAAPLVLVNLAIGAKAMAIDQIYLLGPEGTFSDHAARRFRDHLARIGQAKVPDLSYTRTIPEALELASQHPLSRAVTPMENSESGMVVATQDYLARHGLFIDWEINVRVRFRILSDAPLAEVIGLYVHPVALEQCDTFVARQLPRAHPTFTRSNIDSALRWRDSPSGDRMAAIVPYDALPGRSAFVDVPDIQNDQQNTTRFVVARSGRGVQADYTRAKTSLLISPDADRPGLLFEILSVFKKHGINLCRIESRPARTRPWAYVFYMDITNNGGTGDAVRELFAGRWTVTVLGTFDELPAAP